MPNVSLKSAVLHDLRISGHHIAELSKPLRRASIKPTQKRTPMKSLQRASALEAAKKWIGNSSIEKSVFGKFQRLCSDPSIRDVLSCDVLSGGQNGQIMRVIFDSQDEEIWFHHNSKRYASRSANRAKTRR